MNHGKSYFLRQNEHYLSDLPDKFEPYDEFDLLDHRADALGFKVIPSIGDGNCVLRSISVQLFDTEDQHPLVRAAGVAQMRSYPHYYISGTLRNVRAVLNSASYHSVVDRNVYDVLTQAVADAYSIKIFELVPYSPKVIQEFIPHDGIFKKIVYICSSEQHTDALYLKSVLSPKEKKYLQLTGFHYPEVNFQSYNCHRRFCEYLPMGSSEGYVEGTRIGFWYGCLR